MNNYFQLSKEQQQMVLTQAASKTGLPVQAVEKDLWVTVALQMVFTLPVANHLVFKGGTSLSKVWKVIHRFSEDIDLAIDPSIWGFEGDLTKKQIKRLRKASSLFVRDELCQSLKEAVTEAGMEKWLQVEADPDGEDDETYPEPRVIHIRYKSLFDEDLPYLHSEVKLEVGARSLLEPTADAAVTSVLEDALPISTTVRQVMIPTALAEKTFLEKAFLLHELFSSQTSREANRKSRHLYDLAQMMSTDIAARAIANDELWNTIHHHRELFTSMSGVDYTPDIRKQIRLLPPDDVIDDWRNDYKDMQSSMIYGEKPIFEELMRKMEELENRFHKQ
ncbi:MULTISPECIES: nucleotidyl transferase AbiEii/AbiGii toxin family protein [Bacteroides]|jgi:predicted nucleotidyltransferase component of viral defense system|uniref:nucleotidyl transferase AbiEii/AbiGii toxin family protein n=1 Tax=Bacteroides TaxID=816 RepID=UPI000E4CA665|nr:MULTISPECIES: nucleotidyl transferase AbiEii/AbiGii toxin family protein [Bacteroides]RGU23303.1 nucleotidyl transferase AbiEii/AbiGii toxin family protein [Bacteroides cellulosilyticus]